MRYTATNIIIFIVFLQLSNAIEFDFKYIQDFSSKQINVNIELDSSNRYDVKVFLHNSTNNKVSQKDIISQTLNNDDWQSSWNYIKNSFPDIKTYSIKKLSNSENIYLCVRLRELGKTIFSEVCEKLNSLVKDEGGNIQESEEKILLNSKFEKTNENNVYLSKDQIILNIITYSSILFIVVLFSILLFEYFRQ